MIGIFGSLSMAQKIVGTVFASILLICLGIVGYIVFPTASNQGYAPEQPIPFSHKLHAGDYKIDCKYCHVSANKSRHATIPAMNVCMNCHKVVKTDSPHIQKLTQHFNEGKPIQWVRIHELPDFVFFNHKPHVNIGIACETCHGDVSSMEKVYQSSELTMGWCLDCHTGQTTPRNVLTKIHPDKKNPRNHPAAPINCTTCHY